MSYSIGPYRFFPLLLAAFLLLLSGCGGAYWQWSKPGGSPQQAKQDGFECKQISRQQSYLLMGPMVVGSSDPDFNTWKECLEARGYTVTEQSNSQTSSQSTSQANRCVRSNAVVGGRYSALSGKSKRITALYGTSPRCQDPANPILADVEEMGYSQGNRCVATNATIGARFRSPNGRTMDRITALYGTSPRCPNPAIPLLADAEEVSDSQGSTQSASQGNGCVFSNATVGSRVNFPNGKVKKVTALYGTSPRCSDPTNPLLADVEEVSESQSSSQSSLCVDSNATVGALVRLPNEKVKKVTALHGASPKCSDPLTPILVDVEAE
jgi:hypothetical protein